MEKVHRLTGVECMNLLNKINVKIGLWKAGRNYDSRQWYINLEQNVYGPFSKREDAVEWKKETDSMAVFKVPGEEKDG